MRYNLRFSHSPLLLETNRAAYWIIYWGDGTQSTVGNGMLPALKNNSYSSMSVSHRYSKVIDFLKKECLYININYINIYIYINLIL